MKETELNKNFTFQLGVLILDTVLIKSMIYICVILFLNRTIDRENRDCRHSMATKLQK